MKQRHWIWMLVTLLCALLYIGRRVPPGEGQAAADASADTVKGVPVPSPPLDPEPTRIAAAILSGPERQVAEIVQRLVDRERADAIVLESKPYPKMQSFIVAVPRVQGELRDDTLALLANLPPDSGAAATLKDYLDFTPAYPQHQPKWPNGLIGSPVGPCAWRVLLLSIYDEENKYRFRMIDTNGEPEAALTYYSDGLLTVATGIDTRVEDLQLDEATKRYGHLFSIQDHSSTAGAPLQPVLESLKRRPPRQ